MVILLEKSYQSTKTAEHYWHSLLHSSAKFVSSKTTLINMTLQAKFFSNDINKINFITMLKSEIEAKGIQVKQAMEDVNIMVVETAVSATDKHRHI